MSDINSIYQKASRQKLRFTTLGNGKVTVEDLWDIDINVLDSEAQRLNKLVTENAGGSFLLKKKQDRKQKLQILQLEILIDVIKTRENDRVIAEKRSETKAQNEQILAIIASKETDNLKNLPIEELHKKLSTQEEED